MKRDMDLVRQILFDLEEAPYDGNPLRLHVEGHSREELTYHVMLLNEAGLISAFNFSSELLADWRPSHLTWAGHEFINAARDNGRWNKAKSLVKEKGGGIVFEVLKQVLFFEFKTQVFGEGTTD